MKKLLLVLFVSHCFFIDGMSQIGVEVQAGGANILGLTVNSRFNIPLSESKKHSLSPSIGVGVLAPWWYRQTMVINTGITYNYKSWGIGTEFSRFVKSPFSRSKEPMGFVDMIVYPNLNYTFTNKSNWYLRISAGSYFAFSKESDPMNQKTRLRFDGDVIPGAGISVGYLFR